MLGLLLASLGWTPEPCAEMGVGEAASGEQVDPAGAHHGHHAAAQVASVVGSTADMATEGTSEHHPSDTPVCDMAGHCTATLPGLTTVVAGFVPVVHAESASRPGWRLHLAPPSHLTPPPKA